MSKQKQKAPSGTVSHRGLQPNGKGILTPSIAHVDGKRNSFLLETEKLVLGGLIKRPETIQKLKITAEEFSCNSHKTLFKEIVKLNEQGVKPDLEKIVLSLRERGLIDSVGGVSYVASLDTTLSANLEFYVHKLRNYNTKKNLEVAIKKVLEQTETADPEEILNNLKLFLEKQTSGKKTGGENLFDPPTPWPEAVKGKELLDEIVNTLDRFVVLPPGAAESIALWIVASYRVDDLYLFPNLVFTSATKRCGKTTAITVLSNLVKKPLVSTNATAAAIFRAIEKYKPTLILDEQDTNIKIHEELRTLLNGSHTRKTAYVLRCVGEDHEVKQFSTWCPKVFSLIGSLPDTLMDRSITIKMHRKTPNEIVEHLRQDCEYNFTELKSKIVRFLLDNREHLNASEPKLPPELDDRQADNWRPLFQVAEIAGGDWPERARKAAILLSGEKEEPDVKVGLLVDIKNLCDELGVDRLPTKKILEHLVSLEDKPWAEFKNGRPISANSLAKLLHGFGIRPTTFKENGVPVKGYLLKDFLDSFSRYLPTSRNSVTEADNSLHKNELGGYGSVTVTSLKRNQKDDSESVTFSIRNRNPGRNQFNSLLDNDLCNSSYEVTDSNRYIRYPLPDPLPNNSLQYNEINIMSNGVTDSGGYEKPKRKPWLVFEDIEPLPTDEIL